MFRLDHIWWCDGAVEDCSETAGLFPGQLELDDGCLIVQALPADAPGSIRIVYLGGPHARWDADAMAVILASGTTIRLGEPAEFTASWLDAEAYLARHQITSVPDEFLQCAQRTGGQVLNQAPWDIVETD